MKVAEAPTPECLISYDAYGSTEDAYFGRIKKALIEFFVFFLFLFFSREGKNACSATSLALNPATSNAPRRVNTGRSERTDEVT